MSEAFDRIVAATAAALVVAGTMFAGSASAFDGSPTTPGEDPAMAFRVGAKAYYSGDKKTALEALEIAARQGHAAAQWKIARMYAEGDGVAEDDFKAFQYFSQLASAHADDNPASPNARYTASAFVALGSYYLTGISDSAIKPNVKRARDMFTYAASYFGDVDAQYRLALMYLKGTGGERDPLQGARWLKHAAERGHLRAQVMLGDLLYNGGALPMRRPVDGLMWLTIALQRASEAERAWIAKKQEAAFSNASEDQRRRAVARAEDWLARWLTN